MAGGWSSAPIGDPDVSGTHDGRRTGFSWRTARRLRAGGCGRAGRSWTWCRRCSIFLALPIGRDMDGYARTDLFQRAFTEDRPITFIPTYDRYGMGYTSKPFFSLTRPCEDAKRCHPVSFLSILQSQILRSSDPQLGCPRAGRNGCRPHGPHARRGSRTKSSSATARVDELALVGIRTRGVPLARRLGDVDRRHQRPRGARPARSTSRSTATI